MSMRLSELDAGQRRRRQPGNGFVILGFLVGALTIGVLIGWIIKMNGEIYKINNDLESLRSQVNDVKRDTKHDSDSLRSQIIDVRKDVKSEADRADRNFKILRDQIDAIVRVLKQLP